MDGKLEVGGMALIVGAYSVTENIGRTVELVQFIPFLGSLFIQDGYFEAGPEGLWVVTGENLIRNTDSGRVVSNLSGCAPQHLRPLHGLLSPAQQSQLATQV